MRVQCSLTYVATSESKHYSSIKNIAQNCSIKLELIPFRSHSPRATSTAIIPPPSAIDRGSSLTHFRKLQYGTSGIVAQILYQFLHPSYRCTSRDPLVMHLFATLKSLSRQKYILNHKGEMKCDYRR